MSSFDSQPMYKDRSMWDYTDVWWARHDRDVHWADNSHGEDPYKPKPWVFPNQDPDGHLEPDFQKAIESTGGTWYELTIEETDVVPEGILFLNDAQMGGVGFVWSLFDPEKEVKAR